MAQMCGYGTRLITVLLLNHFLCEAEANAAVVA